MIRFPGDRVWKLTLPTSSRSFFFPALTGQWPWRHAVLVVFLSSTAQFGLHAADCNGNGIDDRQSDAGDGEVVQVDGVDCNVNGVPDECETGPLSVGLGGALQVPSSARSIFAADFDGDGLSDVVAGTSREFVFWRGLEPSTEDAGVLLSASGEVTELEDDLARDWTIGDLDGDGDLDIAALLREEVAVFVNLGDGTFAAGARTVLEIGVQAFSLVDLNGNEQVDLVVTNRIDDTVTILLGQGDGTFSFLARETSGNFPGALDVGDIDADGDIDVVVANRDEPSLTIFFNRGDGHLDRAPDLSELTVGLPRPEAILLVDTDGDKRLEIISAHWTGVLTWTNLGEGRFSDPTTFLHEPRRPTALASGDIDQDGDQDVIVASSAGDGLRLLHNEGGVFVAGSTFGLEVAPLAVAVLDVDDNGTLDVLAGVVSQDAILILSNTEGSEGNNFALRPPTRYGVGGEPHGADRADMDGDGNIDVITANNQTAQAVSVILNQGDGTFAAPRTYSPGGNIFSVTPVDVDGDGDLDIAGADTSASSLTIALNAGDGTFLESFRTSVAGVPWHVTAGDFDGDGAGDIVASLQQGGSIAVLSGRVEGQVFARKQHLPVGSGPQAAVVADLNEDGSGDIAVANGGSSSLSVFLNAGGSDFEEPITVLLPGSPSFVATGHFDNDDRRDLAVTSPQQGSVLVIWNDGNDGFPAITSLPHDRQPQSASTGDLNADGLDDIVTGNPGSQTISVLLGVPGRLLDLPRHFGLGGGSGPRFTLTADFDGSGDRDIISANHDTNDFSVFLNRNDEFSGDDYVESICTLRDFYRISIGTASGAQNARSPFERSTKFVLPARPDPALLPPLFQNTKEFDLHQDFLISAFPERFGGLTGEEYDQLVGRRATRQYFVGALQRLLTNEGFVYVFSLAVDTSRDFGEVLRQEEVAGAYQTLSEVFQLQPLRYLPDTELARREAEAWTNPLFPVHLEDLSAGIDFEPYTLGVGYGRVRVVDLEEFHSANEAGRFTFQDVLVIDQAPRDIEGVVGGVITAEIQGPLSHVAIRTARRGTPNAFVRGAREAFEPFAGKLVRLEVFAAEYFITEAAPEEAEAFWETNRPQLERDPTADANYGNLDSLLEVDLTLSAPESRYGGKAANFARLQGLLTGELAQYAESGFVIPTRYYLEFLRQNTLVVGAETLTYEEHLRRLLGDDGFQSDSERRFQELESFRDLAREQGVVDSDLVGRLVNRVEEVFGSRTRTVRFRSSSNVEDALVFNGAGLYESTSVCVLDSLDGDDQGPSACDPTQRNERTIERALKKVWASLWTFRAHEERTFFQIPTEGVAMGILVSRAFLDETANGVAFTGNPQSAQDRRYVITAQAGEESVVSPEPGTSVERTVLTVEDGQVSDILRERSSSLIPPGETVLSDDQLRELGRLLWQVDQNYPLDLEGFEREQVLLDFEFKVEPNGALAVKQVRPFLIPDTAPKSPTFTLEIPGGTTLCGVFSEDRVGRLPQTELELKSTVRLREGSWDLPTASGALAADLIEDVRFGSEEAVAVAEGSGRFTFVRVPDTGSRTIYRFRYAQKFTVPSGETFEIRIENINFTGRGDLDLTGPIALDDDYNTFELDMTGDLMGIPQVGYSSCGSDLLPQFEINVELPDGARFRLEERFLASENNLGTGPGSLVRADIELAGEQQTITDYWSLVYAARRHNRNVQFWVVLEPAIAIADLPGPVQVIEIRLPGPLDGSPTRVAYLDASFAELRVFQNEQLRSFERHEVEADRLAPFRRGDVDATGTLDLTDGIVLASFLFASGPELSCEKAADIDDSGRLDLTDAVQLMTVLFLNALSPLEPFETCGADATEDTLTCTGFSPCADP